ncbi:hypothetical protein [Arthrobacter dokdonensis]|uniref:hypothetical protein n=1 Tax=Arthrobacter dokdonellae TaxID=2211210 RepID=UPI000DE5810D|nr:hypothetical protein [Arthrobacter dokdonellae]
MARTTDREPKTVPPATRPEVTDADVDAADAAAKEAQDLVAELEEKVINGDDTVTPDQIVAQESLGRFARLRAAATRRKADAAKEAARLRDCQILHDEMTDYASKDGQRLANLYQAIYDAREEFQAVVEERNATVASWHRRAEALGIAQDDGRPVPKENDGRVSLGRGTLSIRTEGTVFAIEHVPNYLGSHDSPIRFDAETVAARVAKLRKIDEPDHRAIAEYIYKGANGAIVQRDRPFTAEEVSHLGVRLVGAAEAWPE